MPTLIENNESANTHSFRDRVMGCWLGKAVGGTLGMPYEGVRHTLDLTFYDPVPDRMLPNDDLDLQVVYAVLLAALDKPRVDRDTLSRAWDHIGMSPDEYGICKRNLALGLKPPTTGLYDNPFQRGMGAAIRTELWACLAAGDPETAVRYAYEDACMDHGAEGIHAAQFLAAIEAAAFVESDRDTLLDIGLSHIPEHSELTAAIRNTRAWWAQHGDWSKVQSLLANRYVNDNFTDVVINLTYIVLGWLAGDGFGDAICKAVNGGQDTDCTGATLGSILGILDPDSIEDHWLRPIGRDLVLSPCITGIEHPPTLDGFTDMVLELRERLETDTPAQPGELQPTDHLAIPAQLGWTDAWPDAKAPPPAVDGLTPIRFEGNSVSMPIAQAKGPFAVLRYKATIKAEGPTKFVFASDRPVRVWIDQQNVIDSPGGDFVPALHRTTPNVCCTHVELKAGEHVIDAVIDARDQSRALRWHIAFAEPGTTADVCDYLVDPLRPDRG
ncbi:MAG: ADP-ribosylglycohydrolase family protein [Planctomycetota bacterium]